MPRQTKSKVERAFDLYAEMTTDERQTFAAMIAGYNRANGEEEAPKPRTRRPRNTAAPAPPAA